MISGAEAHRIGRALESVADWTSEIIVVLNDDVNDGTDRISESFGAHVLREPWKGFIAQKNSASAKATQPWLLNLDADEVQQPRLGGLTSSASSSAPPCPTPPTSFPAALSTPAAGFATATGIPTASAGCGDRAARGGPGMSHTPNSRLTAALDGCERTCCTTAWRAWITRF